LARFVQLEFRIELGTLIEILSALHTFTKPSGKSGVLKFV